MAGTDKQDGRNPGAGSGEAVEDARLRVAEGGAGKNRNGGGEAASDEVGGRTIGHGDGESGSSGNGRKGEENKKDGRNIGNGEGGGLDTQIDCMPFVHIGRSFRLVFVFGVLLATACWILAPWAWVLMIVGPAGYPVLAAWSYYWFRRSGRSAGPSSDMMPVALTLMCVSLALLVSDQTVLAGLLSAVFGLAFCGTSTGEWLAVVAMRRKTGFRGAVRAAWLLERQARERAWRPLAGEG